MVAEANRDEKASEALTEEFAFEALGSEANFDRVLYDGERVRQLRGARQRRGARLHRPARASSSPSRCTSCSRSGRQRQARRHVVAAAPRPERAPAGAAVPHAQGAAQLLNSLVGLCSKNTGEPHGLIHAELRRVCGGPAVAQASVTQLQARIDFLRKRLGRTRRST